VADEGHSISCEVTASNSAGPSAPEPSANSDSVPLLPTLPVSIVAPEVAVRGGGAAVVGKTLSCSSGTWTGTPTPTFSYSWLRDGVPIGAAEANTYTVTTADEGHSISCQVTATNTVGSKSTVSANSDAIREEAREKHEAEATAAKKHQEEEAAGISTKKQEEQAKTAAAGSVSLASSVIGVQTGGKASVKLECTGTAVCSGKLTLAIKSTTGKGKKKHFKTTTIGTAAFSIPAGKTGVVAIKLTAAGSALLKAGHGKLSASLTIVKSSPSPTSTERASVTLVQKTATKAKTRKR